MGESTETTVMRAVYTFFLGVLVALFVGLGIATALPGPAEPAAPPAVAVAQQSRELTPAEEQQWRAYEQQRERWEEAARHHSRTVGLAALVASVLLLVLSLSLERRRRVLAEGVLLGGLFTLLHSIVRSLVARDTVVTFAVVTTALVLVLAVGYRRYVLRPGDRAPDSERQRELLVEQGPDGGDVDVRDGGVLPDR